MFCCIGTRCSIIDVIIADVCPRTSSLVMCVNFWVTINGKWVIPMSIDIIFVSQSRGGVDHFLMLRCKCSFLRDIVHFVALSFSPCSCWREVKPTNHQQEQKASRLNCRVKVTVLTEELFFAFSSLGRLFAVAKTHTKLTPNPLAKEQASSECLTNLTDALLMTHPHSRTTSWFFRAEVGD